MKRDNVRVAVRFVLTFILTFILTPLDRGGSLSVLLQKGGEEGGEKAVSGW